MIGLIVGSGYAGLALSCASEETATTPYGAPSSTILTCRFGQTCALAIVRHGAEHTIPPHEVNYRANLWALDERGVAAVLAVNVVGAIGDGFAPGEIAIPDQLIDYTWGRASSFGPRGGEIPHIDFTEPFDAELRGCLAAAASDSGLEVRRGCYGVTQGPRLETAAEIERLARDGCTMVGMTAMPEAALARELGLRYALIAVAVNHAAGRSPSGAPIHAELESWLDRGMQRAARLLDAAVPTCDALTL